MKLPMYMRSSAAIKLTSDMFEENMSIKRLAEVSGTSEVYVEYMMSYSTEMSQIKYLLYFARMALSKKSKEKKKYRSYIEFFLDEDDYERLRECNKNMTKAVIEILENWRQENDCN